MKKTIMAATVLALMATGANADAFGECAAKIATAKIVAEGGLGAVGEAILMAHPSTRGVERSMTGLGKNLKKLLDQGMEFDEVEDKMLRAGGDPDVLRIAGLCQNKL